MKFAGKWMEPEKNILGKVTQTQKAKCHALFLICMLTGLVSVNSHFRRDKASLVRVMLCTDLTLVSCLQPLPFTC